jgi:hypothetical protein
MGGKAFYEKYWLHAARKCSEHMDRVRRGFTCVIADKRSYNNHMEDQKSHNFRRVIETDEESGERKEVFIFRFNNKTCLNFVNECLEYIELKAKLVERMNIQYVLSLCDEDGKYLATKDLSDWKRALPNILNHPLYE